ncbi:hypothetical protein LINGRAHAP2_LOCUS8640 [Linum grandiflorum]
MVISQADDSDGPICNWTPIQDGDPYARALAKVSDDIFSQVLKLVYPVNEYCTSGSFKRVKAYGLGSCVDQIHDDDVDCVTCLKDALTAISNACGSTYGAQVAIPGCSLRFEPYRFC